jgi:hypothetical protein
MYVNLSRLSFLRSHVLLCVQVISEFLNSPVSSVRYFEEYALLPVHYSKHRQVIQDKKIPDNSRNVNRTRKQNQASSLRPVLQRQIVVKYLQVQRKIPSYLTVDVLVNNPVRL